MKLGIPVNVNTSLELHKITLQGKQDKNCFVKHATHIAKWVVHAIIANALLFHLEMSYNDEYIIKKYKLMGIKNKQTKKILNKNY